MASVLDVSHFAKLVWVGVLLLQPDVDREPRPYPAYGRGMMLEVCTSFPELRCKQECGNVLKLSNISELTALKVSRQVEEANTYAAKRTLKHCMHCRMMAYLASTCLSSSFALVYSLSIKNNQTNYKVYLAYVWFWYV